ncbi:MAG: hypothetical protein WC748_09445 [Legionellales bacterium]|jgi:WD40 repeat protein
MPSLHSEQHKAYCDWLIERACQNKTPAQETQIREFHQQLSASLIALVSGIETLSSGMVAARPPLLLGLINFALNLAPVAGAVAAKALNVAVDQKITVDQKRLNALLGDENTRKRLVERFCAQATYYHHAQVLNPGQEIALTQAARDQTEKLLSQLPLSLPSNLRVLAEKITLQFAQSLGEAAQKPYDFPANDPDKLMVFLVEYINLVSEAPLVSFANKTSTSFHLLELSDRWKYVYQLLRLSFLAYEHETKIRELADAWKYNTHDLVANEFRLIESDRVRCIVLANQDQVLITFRGTDNLSNVFTDVKILSTTAPGLGQIHTGFLKAYQEIKNQLHDILNFYVKFHKDVPFIFTGHSLGGALAVLAANDYVQHNATQVLTFGQPKIGMTFKAEAAEILNNCVYRFVNPKDPVVQALVHYSDVGRIYILPELDLIFDWEQAGQLAPFVKVRPQAHSLFTYQLRIKSHAQNEMSPVDQIDNLEREFMNRATPLANIPNNHSLTLSVLQTHLTASQIANSSEHAKDLTALNQLLTNYADISVDCLRLLEEHMWKSDFLHYPEKLQQVIIDLFVRGLEQHLINGGEPFRPRVTNAQSQLDKLKNKPGISPLTREALERLQFYLAWSIAQHQDLSHQHTPILALLKKTSTQSLSAQQARIFSAIEQLQQTDFFKTQKALAEACILSLLAHAPEYNEGSIVAAQAYLYTQRNIPKPMHWHRAALDLLLRRAQHQADVWPVILGESLTSAPQAEMDAPTPESPQLETMLMGLNYWLQGEASFTPGSSLFLDLTATLQALKASHSDDILLNFLCDVYQDTNESEWHILANKPSQHSSLHQALYKAAQNTKFTAHIRFKAWQYYEALLSQGQTIMSVEDCMQMGQCAMDAEEFNTAIRIYKKAYDFAKQSLANVSPSSVEAGALNNYLTNIKSKLTDLLYSKTQQSTTPWQKAKLYLDLVNYAPAEHPVHRDLFECVLATGLTSIRAKLSQLAVPINMNDENDKIGALEQGEILIQVFEQYWRLKKEYAADLFENDHIRPTNKAINPSHEDVHNVAYIGDLHFKENPGCSGLAFAAWALSACFFLDDNPNTQAPGFIPALPAKIVRRYQGNEQTIHVQLTPHAPGENLKTLLDKKSAALSSDVLDARAFSAVFILSLLLDLEDGRAPNWVLNQGVLTSIDNDHILIRELFKGGKLELKNILFCLDEMDKPIHADIRAIVTDMLRSPLPRMRLWLQILGYYTQQIHNASTNQEIADLFNRPNDKDKVILEPFFHPQAMGRLYIKWFKLRAALQKTISNKNVYITHHDLHAHIQSDVAKHYVGVRKPNTYPLERFKKIMPGTKTCSTALIAGKIVPPKTTVNSWHAQPAEYTGYEAFKANCATPSELLALLPGLQKADNAIELIINEIAQGYLDTFIEMPEAQAGVLASLKPEMYRKMTVEFHQALLNAISTEIIALTFRGDLWLTDKTLMDLINRLTLNTTQKLEGIVLNGCEQLTGFVKRLGNLELYRNISYVVLTEFCKRGIKKIRLSTCENLSPDLLEALPAIWQEFPQVEWDIQPTRTWVNSSMAHIAAVYPDKGLPIPTLKYLQDEALRHVRNIKKVSLLKKQHSASVNALTVLHNGWLASGSDDNSIKIWEVNSHDIQLLHTMKGHSYGVSALTVLSNGWLASGSGDHTIKIWEVNSQGVKLLHTIQGHSNGIESIIALPNGWLASGSDDKTIKIWEVNAQGTQLMHTLLGHADRVRALTVLPNGWLASGSDDNTIKIWEVNTQGTQLMHTLLGHADRVRALTVLSNGWLASGSGDLTIKIWEVNTQDSQRLRTIHGHSSTIVTLTALSNGWLVSGSVDNTIKIWELKSQGIHLLCTIQGHSNIVRVLTILPNGWLASGSWDKTIKIWPLCVYELDDRLNNANKTTRLLHNARELLIHNRLRLEQVPLLFTKEVAKGLTTFDISNTRITDTLLTAILDCCPRLVDIKYDNCGWLSEEGIALITVRKQALSTVSNNINNLHAYHTHTQTTSNVNPSSVSASASSSSSSSASSNVNNHRIG